MVLCLFVQDAQLQLLTSFLWLDLVCNFCFLLPFFFFFLVLLQKSHLLQLTVPKGIDTSNQNGANADDK